ncbi:Putative ankyrin repeat-containing domain superfamily [Septoria linicola]|uniref:Ankyrin repeat-containing domain superfamily n=1 Tax=Septoria linicola TaxID=215465 RepID=A0A9Q9AUH6_9PEZI|nr:putative ankyrin repeat-containing domain superfamily [Septoria linicola]USW55370.1 Putative ankyrin repeat-containing domain superfamily [Septoria linicola]
MPPHPRSLLSEDECDDVYHVIEQDNVPRLEDYMSHHSYSRRSLLGFNKIYTDSNWAGDSLLHTAVESEALAIVKYLLAAGIPIDVLNKKYNTPLHYAAWFPRMHLLLYLIEANADVNKVNSRGENALHCLALNDDHPEHLLSATRALIDKGINIDLADEANKTALCNFHQLGHEIVVEELLEHGASVDGAIGDFGSSPVMSLCQKRCTGWEAVLEVLLHRGADVDICRPRRKGEKSSTALAEAGTCFGRQVYQEEMHSMVSRLLAAGANPNIGDTSVLVSAFAHGSAKTFKLLLEHGADPSRVTQEAIHEIIRNDRSKKVPTQEDEKNLLLEQYTAWWQELRRD